MTDERDFFSVVGRQRACREFADRAVDEEVVARVLDAATKAPSAENAQPWEFVVVRDPETRAVVGRLIEAAWKRGGRDWAAGRLSPSLLADVDRGASGGVAGAPVIVVVGVDLERCPETEVATSIGPAVQNLLLAATALGLGSALTTLATYSGDRLRELVGLPSRIEPVAVVPLGWPARPLGPPRREPFAEHTHRERFGRPW